MTTKPDNAALYEKLAAPFDDTFHDNRGGVELEYITGEQCITRLNEGLGFGGWSFETVSSVVMPRDEGDEVVVHGRLTVYLEGRSVIREQWGSQKVKRSRSNGVPLDWGFDYKGAATDALKKCASLIGVGLYLSKKEQPPTQQAQAAAAPGSPTPAPARASAGKADENLACDECGAILKETRFKDGTTWGPQQLAGYGRRKHGKVLCMDHYRTANEARRTELLSA